MRIFTCLWPVITTTCKNLISENSLPCQVVLFVEPEDIHTCTFSNPLQTICYHGCFCRTVTQNKDFLLWFKRRHLSGTRSKAPNYVYHTWPHVRTREWNEDIAPVDQVQDKERGKKSSPCLSVYTYTVQRKWTRPWNTGSLLLSHQQWAPILSLWL